MLRDGYLMINPNAIASIEKPNDDWLVVFMMDGKSHNITGKDAHAVLAAVARSVPPVVNVSGKDAN
jgi:hypothetical protein